MPSWNKPSGMSISPRNSPWLAKAASQKLKHARNTVHLVKIRTIGLNGWLMGSSFFLAT
jgi:hypothetical protein